MAYAALIISILLAGIGDYYLKKSRGFSDKRFTFLAVLFYIPVLFLLSIAMLTIPVGVTYATWSGLGILVSTSIGVWLFQEKINAKIVMALGTIMMGVLIINLS